MIRISDVKRVGDGKQMAKAVSAQPSVVRRPHAKQKTIPRADFTDGSAADRLLVRLLEDAAGVNASTVHIEPNTKDVQVRYRVDGLLRPGKHVPRTLHAGLVGRVKLLANLDENEFRVPQDGRFKTELTKKQYLVRAAVLPMVAGEKIVLHITDQSAAPHDLEKLGFEGSSLHALQDATTQVRGLILVSGPASSGKTATLHAIVQMLIDPTRNIVAVEDTVERHLPGVDQTVVHTNAGMTYTGALRAALRQDPNILMIGDIREPEAADLALQAALAGRLVVAGIHTYSVADALAHLVAMNAEPYLLASATKAVVNQRLVRRLCVDCRESYKPTSSEFETACLACGLQPAEAIAHLQQTEKSAENKAISGSKVVRLWRANPVGCAACGQTGYKGRIVIAEVLTTSPATQRLISSSAAPGAIYDQAIAEGMVPLPLDGLIKALRGQTSLEEVLRVVTS